MLCEGAVAAINIADLDGLSGQVDLNDQMLYFGMLQCWAGKDGRRDIVGDSK